MLTLATSCLDLTLEKGLYIQVQICQTGLMQRDKSVICQKIEPQALVLIYAICVFHVSIKVTLDAFFILGMIIIR